MCPYILLFLAIRAVQRAFHERKRDQLATLQARVQQLEQGETERYVQLQTIDQRLREENEALKKENAALSEEITRLIQRGEETGPGPTRPQTRVTRKRTVSVPRDAPTGQERKKARLGTQNGPSSSASHYDASSSIVDIEDPWYSMTAVTTPSLTMDSTPSSNSIPSPAVVGCATDDRVSAINPDPSRTLHEVRANQASFDSCGLCSETTPCICRELFREDVMRNETEDLAKARSISPVVHSILDNLPPYQPPVPLKRRSKSSSTSSKQPPVFLIYDSASATVAPVTESVATCSGDPNNCSACSDDSFGKAFCSALSSACSAGRCRGCAGKRLRLARDPTSPTADEGIYSADGIIDTITIQPTSRPSVLQPVFGSAPMGPPTTMPTAHAWATLKAHPAIQCGSFHNLDLLATVVAQSTRCASPRINVELSPLASGDDRGPESARTASGAEAMKQCHGRRLVEVRTRGVHEALALLDDHMREDGDEEEG